MRNRVRHSLRSLVTAAVVAVVVVTPNRTAAHSFGTELTWPPLRH